MSKDTVESNLALMQRYAKAWEDGDMATADACFAEDLKAYQAGSGTVSGDFTSLADWKTRWLAPITKMTSGQITDGSWAKDLPAPELVFASDTVVAFTLHEKYSRAGKENLVTKRLAIYEIKGGKIVRIRFYDENQQKYDAFFS